MMRTRCVAKFKLLLLTNNGLACTQPSCVPGLIKPQHDCRQINGGRNIEEVRINSPNSTKQLGIAIQTASSVLCGCGCGCECGWETFTTWVRSLLKFMREVVTGCLGVVLCPISVCIRDCTILFYHAWNCVELLRFLALKCVSYGPRMIRCEMQKSGLTGRRAGAFLAIGLVRCNGGSKIPGGKGRPSST